MKKILLNRLSLKHFKGLESFDFEPLGQNATVSGQNGSGKTTLADALLWLLFGKDTRGAKLNPKPLDEFNQEKLGLEPTVEAVLVIDGTDVTLKRVQEEKWNTPRGQLEKVRGNDTTKYTIDGVPKMEKEWKAYLETIGAENILQMLFDSTYFMKMNWKNRREILVNMTGLTDEEIIAKDPALKGIEKIIKEYSIDDYRKVLASRKKEIKRQIDGLPARIQEVTEMFAKAKADIGDQSADDIQEQVLEHEADVSDLQNKLNAIAAGNAVLDHQEELSNLKIKLAEAQSAHLSSTHLESRSLQEDLHKQQRIVNEIRKLRDEEESKKDKVIKQFYDLEYFLTEHRNKYRALKETTFDEHQKVCPTCAQELPADQIEELISKFNQQKAKDMEINIAEGQAAKEKLLAYKETITDHENECARLEKSLKDAEETLNKINAELVFLESSTQKFEETSTYKKIQDEIKLVQQKILNATSDTAAEEQDLKEQIRNKRESIAELQAKFQRLASLSDYENRIEELKKEDAALKVQNQDLERELFLLDEFTRKKVKSLEESINSKFDLVKFKLFNILKNGGIEEVCEATYDGVEYGASLNTGARVNCDLDIVNTLSREFGLSVPTFVDNTESVNNLHQIDSQMIELRVTKNKNLKVEVV
ncbi:P-loop containing region of AAA domain-containing protein [Enterococcus casseliflavus]|uniref:ATP-binding protein n=1 Tax=Enterococcus casseliflavus TaxID=37734 RepID=UPI0008F1A165|nr:AAA family ATPase [Enterococcus casseliflavus]SFD57457.1 P-loop containing region of AAA domain-containing protein [Enterococcus casseliflavus]